jgi:hypothetical protein
MNKNELLKPSGKICPCGASISNGRVAFSSRPDICTSCDDTQRKGAIQVITGKTANTVQIVDAETSARINRLQDRKGGIVSAGMKGTAKTTTL